MGLFRDQATELIRSLTPRRAEAQSSQVMKGAMDESPKSPTGGTSFSRYALGSQSQLLSHQAKSSTVLPSPCHSSAQNFLWLPTAKKTKFKLHMGVKRPSKPASNPPFWLHSTRLPHDPPSFPSSPLHLKPTSPPRPSGSPVYRHTSAQASCEILPCFSTSSISTNSMFPPTPKPLEPCLILFQLRRGNDFSLLLTTFTGVQQFSYYLEDEMLYIFHAYGLYFTKWCQPWYSNLPFLLSSTQCNWWHLLGLIF